ncbi:MAG: S49 family peptidase [Burkholderiaceae bacterium]|nr:S49 family peptidase [Burkholderiaceae bacterium]
MKNYLRLSSMLFNQPLMVTPDMLDLGVRWANQALHLNIINIGPSSAIQAAIPTDFAASNERMAANDGRASVVAQTGVAVIPVSGALVPRGANLNLCETMTSYEGMRASIRQAIADPMVERIVLDIDSPGGAVAGAFELAADIRAMSQQKPITGLVNFMAYSGGYLIASACTEIVVSMTSGVGSIGVIASHVDKSAMAEKLGVKVTTVFAGAHKNDLTPHEPISDQSLRVLTDLVEESYAMFTSAVADYIDMPVSKVRATDAGLFRGQSAIDAGLAHRLASPQDALDEISYAVAQTRAQRQAGRLSVRAAAMRIQASL